MTSRSFDLISDLHLDFWLGTRTYWNFPADVESEHTKRLVSSLLPKTPSSTLVIAGDLGHDNLQNISVLMELRNYYRYIVLVRGNHDLYLVSPMDKKEYGTSEARWLEMQNLCSMIEGVHVLDGTVVTLGEISFGGVGMWYDFDFGQRYLGKSYDDVKGYWYKHSNDSRKITKIPSFEEEYRSLQHVLSIDPDVVVTHIPPFGDRLRRDYLSRTGKHAEPRLALSYYSFHGYPLLPVVPPRSKYWCFGHLHGNYSLMYNNWSFHTNALGYSLVRKPWDLKDFGVRIRIRTIFM